MKIKDIFKKDIFRNFEGVVTIGNEDEEQKWIELEEYVCTNEITASFRTFFSKYRESLNHPTDKIGVWVTGFFGSGKSHFLKILGYILENDVVAGVNAVDYFNEKISNEMVLADMRQCTKVKNKVVLFNIDSKAKSDSKLKNQAIMDIMLRAFNESVGYCGSNPWVADLERTLDAEGLYENFVSEFESVSTRTWVDARAKALLNKDSIVKALVASRKMSEESAKQFIDDQMKNFTNTTEEFAKIVNDYCKENKTRVVFLMDEVGQFIGDNTQLMLNLQTCVEDLGKYCRGQAWVVITSQQELKAMLDSTKDKQQDFSKIQGRFDTRILLSGANADEVIKRRILEKKDNAITPLKAKYDANSSKLSNLILFQAKPTWSGYKDAEEFATVYPFVSYQFELLQKVFESIREHGMSEGKHLSQNERSLLSAFKDSAKAYAECEDGILVPFDSFYSTIEQFIDFDIKTVFANAEKRPTIDSFALRVLRVLFMIKHVKEMPATIDRLATLLAGNINEDKVALKEKIANALTVLEAETLIQKNGEEYDFLTNAEQDVNRQINNSGYSETEVKKAILDIIYDKVVDNNKLRYEGRYDFGLNRWVDDINKGANGQDNITVRVYTQFTSNMGETEFMSESSKQNCVVIDLTAGTFVDELIRADKIRIFKINNSTSVSAALTEIISKKMAELSDRKKRAEDLIRQVLRTAPIYVCGSKLDIKEKDGKDRITDALKEMVKQDYYKLSLVSRFFDDQKSVRELLDDNTAVIAGINDIDSDPNKAAIEEIQTKIKDDALIHKQTTVKALVEYFTKKPYGWRDLDVLGMIAKLWKVGAVQFTIHDVVVTEKDSSFKNDYPRKQGIDTIVVRQKKKIDDQILFKARKIMNDVFSVNIPMDETKLFEGVTTFFEAKIKFLSDLKIKYKNDFVGSGLVAKLYTLFDSVIRSHDAATVFEELKNNEDALLDNADYLEQLEAFYKDNSSQQKTFKDAVVIVDWYNANSMLQDLSSLTDTVEKINEITSMELPFSKMSDLADLVFKAGEIQDKIIEEKFNRVVNTLKADRAAVENEMNQAMDIDITDDKKDEIGQKGEQILATYDSWLSTITKDTPNIDAYLTSSHSSVFNFRGLVNRIINSGTEKPVRSKTVSVIDCIPVANKKIKSKADIDKVLESIKAKLESALEDNDEIDLN